MKVIIVDEHDNQIALKEESALLKTDINRVSALWLTNSKGEILLAQRSKHKITNPEKWSVAAAGTVEEGETYESNIVKEIHEEIGLRGLALEKGPKLFKPVGHRAFVQFFFCKKDVELDALTLQESEVAAARWFTKEEIATLLEETPDLFTPSFKRHFALFKER